MVLGDLVSTLRNTSICIMTTNSENRFKRIYEGESKFFRIDPYEEQLKVLYIAPHRFNSGELFVLCEDNYIA